MCIGYRHWMFMIHLLRGLLCRLVEPCLSVSLVLEFLFTFGIGVAAKSKFGLLLGSMIMTNDRVEEKKKKTIVCLGKN